MTSLIKRRVFCGSVVYGVASMALPQGLAQRPKDRPAGLTLGIGNYGMQSYKVEEAIRLISALKYDALELTAMPDWDSSPEKLVGERRGNVRQLLKEKGLILTSLMENLTPSAADAEHQNGFAGHFGAIAHQADGRAWASDGSATSVRRCARWPKR